MKSLSAGVRHSAVGRVITGRWYCQPATGPWAPEGQVFMLFYDVMRPDNPTLENFFLLRI